MDKAKKRLASAIDGLRGVNSPSSAKLETLDIKEPLVSRDFNLTKVVLLCFKWTYESALCRLCDMVSHMTRALSPTILCNDFSP